MLVTLEPPSAPMLKEAVEAEFYASGLWGRDFPRVQIVTVEEQLARKKADVPPARQTYPQAPVIGEQVTQGALGLGDP